MRWSTTSEAKKYYWLKLKEDFFDDETIRFIEEQPNGVLYSNFYLKLCLKSLKTDGRLIRMVGETLIPYDEKALARLTGVDIDTVRCAMHILKSIGTVKILETGEIYLSQVEEMVGRETDKAVSMRRLRAEQKRLANEGVTMLPERYPEIEIEKELETRDKETETKTRAKAPAYDYDFFRETYNLCGNLPKCRTLAENRKKAIRTFLKDFTTEQWKEICGLADKSKFLTGHNDRNWKADIDFLLRPDKAAKILEGGYQDEKENDNGSERKPTECADGYDVGKIGLWL